MVEVAPDSGLTTSELNTASPTSQVAPDALALDSAKGAVATLEAEQGLLGSQGGCEAASTRATVQLGETGSTSVAPPPNLQPTQ